METLITRRKPYPTSRAVVSGQTIAQGLAHKLPIGAWLSQWQKKKKPPKLFICPRPRKIMFRLKVKKYTFLQSLWFRGMDVVKFVFIEIVPKHAANYWWVKYSNMMKFCYLYAKEQNNFFFLLNHGKALFFVFLLFVFCWKSKQHKKWRTAGGVGQCFRVDHWLWEGVAQRFILNLKEMINHC